MGMEGEHIYHKASPSVCKELNTILEQLGQAQESSAPVNDALRPLPRQFTFLSSCFPLYLMRVLGKYMMTICLQLQAPPSPSPQAPSPINHPAGREGQRKPEAQNLKQSLFPPCSPKQLCISLPWPGQPSPSWGEGGEGGPCRVCMSGAEITTRRAGEGSCLCLSPHPSTRLALTLPPGPMLAWNSSLPLQSLHAKAAPGTFQPASSPASHPLPVPTPLSDPLHPHKGAWTLHGRSPGVFCEPRQRASALPANFAAFPLRLHSSSRAGSTLPRQTPSLSLPGESGEDKPPLPFKHPPARWGPGSGLPPPTLNIYWQSITSKHSTLETDASPAAA